jgi:outer membrane protein
MKNVHYILHAVLALAIAVLFYFQFKGSTPKKNTTSTSSTQKVELPEYSNVIAYVNIDSLESKYEFFKQKKSELEKRQKSIESILQRDAESLQRELYDLQQRAATLTQSEGEAAQERLMKKQYDLENKKNQLAESFLGEQEKFNRELNEKLDSFLTDYNQDKKYAYILSYAKGGQILYKDKNLDITDEVIDGMNERMKAK